MPAGPVCLVVPTYNELENVKPLVEAVKSLGIPELTLLFVDDTSPDGTADVIRQVADSETWVKLLLRPAKGGIGGAYQEGFRMAMGVFSPSVLVQMDADLQHPAAAIPSLVDAIGSGADVAVGSRYVGGGSIEGWSTWRRWVSKVANAYARTMLRLPVRDSTSGFKAYSSGAAKVLVTAGLPAKGFEFQVATLYRLKKGMKIVEVPFSFSVRSSGRSKLKAMDMARFFVGVIKLAVG